MEDRIKDILEEILAEKGLSKWRLDSIILKKGNNEDNDQTQSLQCELFLTDPKFVYHKVVIRFNSPLDVGIVKKELDKKLSIILDNYKDIIQPKKANNIIPIKKTETLNTIVLNIVAYIAVFGAVSVVTGIPQQINDINKNVVIPTNYDPKDFTQVLNLSFRTIASPIISLIGAVLFSFLGLALFKAAGTTSKQTVPSQDFDLVREILLTNNQDAFDNYIKLNSLTGSVGWLTKLGITGLPFATIALTIFFSLLGILTLGNAASTALFDLAKLTLGAFIGSFVQRQADKPERKIIRSVKSENVSPTTSTAKTSQIANEME